MLNSVDYMVELVSSDHFSVLIINDVSGWRRFRGDQARLVKAQWDPIPEWGQLFGTMNMHRRLFISYSCINLIFKSRVYEA